jgi:hypothetical protein
LGSQGASDGQQVETGSMTTGGSHWACAMDKTNGQQQHVATTTIALSVIAPNIR